MTVLPPVLDPRDQAETLDELRHVLAGYVPELNPVEGSAALTLMKVFARYSASLAVGLNRLPARQELAFLDTVGTHLLPARAARVPLVFALLDTSPQDVTLPAGSQAAAVLPPSKPVAGAAPPPTDPLIFATEATITLTRSRLVAVYSIDPGTDSYTNHSANLATGFTTFDAAGQTEHAVYFGHDHLFALAGDITVLLLLTLGNEPDRPLDIAWEYLTDVGWLPLEREEMEDTTLGLIQDGQVSLRRACGPNAKQETIFGHKTFWIRGRLRTPLPPATIGTSLPVINDVVARLNFRKACLSPDAAFTDGASLDVSKDFPPFGSQPQRFTTFYVASKEVFQRQGARVSMEFTLSVPGGRGGSNASAAVIAGFRLAWEYFNGTGWTTLGVEPAETSTAAYAFHANDTVSFRCPADWRESSVNGSKNYWMRIRIVAGDYGLPIRAVVAQNVSTLEASTLKVPVVQSLRFAYAYITDPAALDHCLTYNDFVFADHTEDSRWPDRSFAPFRAVADAQPTIHLGFDRALPAGLVSLYADIAPDREGGEGSNSAPFVWEYVSPRGWTELGVLDETEGMRRSGMIQFIGPPDMAARVGLGGPLFRVRARLKRGESSVSSVVNGVWINSVWASQRSVADRERLGASDGNPGQTFATTRSPLLESEIVEVQEWTGRGERWRLWFDGVPESALRLERDTATGEPTAVWVRWMSQPHLYKSSATDRHYTVERATGSVRFGDGTNGSIPPAGRTIVVSYSSGGGVRGNVPPAKITEVRAAVAYLKSVTNPISASGGADVEVASDVLVRGPQHLRNRDRAVAPLDVEWLAREASPAVARARCLPITGPTGHAERGWITVVVVPFAVEPMPSPSPELRRDVLEHLAARVPATVASRVRVVNAEFVAVGVRAEIVPVESASAAALEEALRKKLNDFLHPVSGGPRGNGWEFGETVHLSQIAALIEGTAGVDYARTLSLVCGDALQGDTVLVGQNALITFGDHELRLTIGAT